MKNVTVPTSRFWEDRCWHSCPFSKMAIALSRAGVLTKLHLLYALRMLTNLESTGGPNNFFPRPESRDEPSRHPKKSYPRLHLSHVYDGSRSKHTPGPAPSNSSLLEATDSCLVIEKKVLQFFTLVIWPQNGPPVYPLPKENKRIARKWKTIKPQSSVKPIEEYNRWHGGCALQPEGTTGKLKCNKRVTMLWKKGPGCTSGGSVPALQSTGATEDRRKKHTPARLLENNKR